MTPERVLRKYNRFDFDFICMPQRTTFSKIVPEAIRKLGTGKLTKPLLNSKSGLDNIQLAMAVVQ